MAGAFQLQRLADLWARGSAKRSAGVEKGTPCLGSGADSWRAGHWSVATSLSLPRRPSEEGPATADRPQMNSARAPEPSVHAELSLAPVMGLAGQKRACMLAGMLERMVAVSSHSAEMTQLRLSCQSAQ